MRTTLTIDPDVASRIEELRRERGVKLKAIVNEALRAGLERMTPRGRPRRRTYRIRPWSGGLRVPNVDNVQEILELCDEAPR
ncbi:MAG: ribbon-helix-helix protein, CopG family [Deltaproteobacteria bacterium]|nr:ribbon-helix-helix protein, CopG family [Deltaproteobacteria bacterium]